MSGSQRADCAAAGLKKTGQQQTYDPDGCKTSHHPISPCGSLWRCAGFMWVAGARSESVLDFCHAASCALDSATTPRLESSSGHRNLLIGLGVGLAWRGVRLETSTLLQEIAAKDENVRMPVVSRFISGNGHPVTKLRTISGVTAYIADEIPLEALIGLEIKLRKKLGLPADREPAVITPSCRNGKPGLKPR